MEMIGSGPVNLVVVWASEPGFIQKLQIVLK